MAWCVIKQRSNFTVTVPWQLVTKGSTYRYWHSSLKMCRSCTFFLHVPFSCKTSCYNWSLINCSHATFKLLCYSARVELAVCFIEHLHSLLTSALDGDEWWPSRAAQFTSGIELDGMLVGLHTRHGRCLVEKSICPCQKTNPDSSVCNPWPIHCFCCKDQIQHVSGRLLANYLLLPLKHASMNQHHYKTCCV